MNWFSSIERILIFDGIGKNAGCLSIAKIEICTLQNPLTAQMCPYDGWFEHKGRTKKNGTLISFARIIGVFPLPQFEWFTGQKCFRIKFFLYKEKHKSDGGGQIWFFLYIDKNWGFHCQLNADNPFSGGNGYKTWPNSSKNSCWLVKIFDLIV